ncbi:hypothetical protein EVAR_82290_1 [Eumeta japonica]|uniref:Uncharacterized protein n=1 Tax=Eumeta variegata TaxID=151549 RepID=A0A4C1VXV4_EUMVA|nr:hypothetical protein EVAR_82290_1 [Eumeta japonica]
MARTHRLAATIAFTGTLGTTMASSDDSMTTNRLRFNATRRRGRCGRAQTPARGSLMSDPEKFADIEEQLGWKRENASAPTTGK